MSRRYHRYPLGFCIPLQRDILELGVNVVEDAKLIDHLCSRARWSYIAQCGHKYPYQYNERYINLRARQTTAAEVSRPSD